MWATPVGTGSAGTTPLPVGTAPPMAMAVQPAERRPSATEPHWVSHCLPYRTSQTRSPREAQSPTHPRRPPSRSPASDSLGTTTSFFSILPPGGATPPARPRRLPRRHQGNGKKRDPACEAQALCREGLSLRPSKNLHQRSRSGQSRGPNSPQYATVSARIPAHCPPASNRRGRWPRGRSVFQKSAVGGDSRRRFSGFGNAIGDWSRLLRQETDPPFTPVPPASAFASADVSR